MIYFVGAGPGAADLLTIRALRLIENADIIVYAGSLVNPEILNNANETCEIYDSSLMNLEEIVDVMIKAYSNDQNLVRLHTGDPSLYGAIKEQMRRLDELGIPYDFCPGISAYQGAASSLKIEYTLPDISQTLILTRAEGKTGVPEREKLCKLAEHHTTMVLYLSSALSEKVKNELLEGGYSPDTPVAVVYRATWPDELIIRSNLNNFSEKMKQYNITKHALIIVGDVLDCDFKDSRLYDSEFSTEYRNGIVKDERN